jgi:ABC-type multidrug transport system permease subunit
MNQEDLYSLSLAAVLCGLLGTIVLAFALSKWMAAVSLSLTTLEAYKDTNGHVNAKGADKHRSSAAKYSQILTYAGLVLIILASALQVIALYFSAHPK